MKYTEKPLAIAMSLLTMGVVENVVAAGQIRIDVVDSASSRPLEKATVTVITREGERSQKETGPEGYVIVDQLDAGLYEVRISSTDYYTRRLPSVRVIDNKTTPVSGELERLRGDFEEVLVLSSNSRRDFLNAVSSAEKDREQLRSAAGGGADVLRSLDGLPGLFSDGQYSSFTVRGNGPRDNLILVDGIPFANVIHFSDAFGENEDVEGGGRYSVFAPNIIARAEFQPGGWQPAYGGLAGSLLQLEVAEGNPETPAATVRLDVAGLEVGYDGPTYLHDNTSILFSARSLDFTRLFETIGLEEAGEPSLRDIVLKTSTEFDNDKIKLLVLNTAEAYQRDVSHALASDEDDVGDYTDVQLMDSDRVSNLYALSWQHFFANNSQLEQRVYHTYFDEESVQGEAYPDFVEVGTPAEDVPVRPNILLSTRTEKETGYRLDYSLENGLGTFSSGVRVNQIDLNLNLTLNEDEWQRFTYDSRDSRPQGQNYVVLTPDNTNNSYSQAETNYALYLNQIAGVGNWEFRAGVRYDRDNFSQQTIVSPRIGATWLPSQRLRISAVAGRYNQAPAYDERASDAGNAALKNEIVDQLSLGMAFDVRDNLELFVEPYYQQINDVIRVQDGTERSLANSGEGKNWGVDTGLSRRFENGWSANFTYSYNDSQVRDNHTADWMDAEFSRPHSASIGGIWEINERWKISSRWKFASGKPSDSYIVHDDVLAPNGPLRYSRERVASATGRYDSFNSLNLRVDYRRAFGRTNVIAFVDVINLLGSKNPNNSDFNERSGEEVEDEGSAVPLIGLRLEW